jgi:N6-adenosine-specific RNA methylase IME4
MPEFHPTTKTFPLLEGEDLDALANDIALHGLLEPIWLDPADGSIVDGRNRWLACQMAGVDPVFQKLESGQSVAGFIMSKNLARMHLSAGQKACLALQFLPMLEAEARERMSAGGKQRTERVPYLISNRGEARTQATKQVGVNPRYISDAKRLHEEAPHLYTEVLAGHMTLPEAKQEIKKQRKRSIAEQIRNEPQPMPEGPFSVLIVDPPWKFESNGSLPYPTMSLDEITNLSIEKLAHEDCILWLWSTNHHLPAAYELVKVWGFQYKDLLTWVKDRFGFGEWLRGRSEHCVLAARGKPAFLGASHDTVIEAARREHSRKPEAFYQLVEATCPGSKCELFGRQERKGWHAWGAEKDLFAA